MEFAAEIVSFPYAFRIPEMRRQPANDQKSPIVADLDARQAGTGALADLRHYRLPGARVSQDKRPSCLPLKQLPGGACARWYSAAFSGRTPEGDADVIVALFREQMTVAAGSAIAEKDQ